MTTTTTSSELEVELVEEGVELQVDEDKGYYYLGEPTIRTWELTEESSHYDRLRAAPSDEQMHRMWIGWSTAFFVFSSFNLVVFLAVLCTKRTRRQPFNQYLLAIMWPDVFYTGTCAIQCAYLAAVGGYPSAFSCHFQSFYLVWSITANGWLNGVVAHEIHVLLRSSARRLRYFPPTAKRIATRVTLCYVMGIFMALWGLLGHEFPSKWFPHRTDVFHGLVCMPLEFDTASTVFFWLCFYPLMIAIPILFTIYVVIDVRRNKLLPPQGKRREVAIFFFRIVIVFLSMWLPSLLVFYLSAAAKNIYGFYISGMWAHSQGAVSAAVSMLKLDIRQAVKDFCTCRTRKANQEYEEHRRMPHHHTRRTDPSSEQQQSSQPTTLREQFQLRSTQWSHFSSRYLGSYSFGPSASGPLTCSSMHSRNPSIDNIPQHPLFSSQEMRDLEHQDADDADPSDGDDDDHQHIEDIQDLDVDILDTFQDDGSIRNSSSDGQQHYHQGENEITVHRPIAADANPLVVETEHCTTLTPPSSKTTRDCAVALKDPTNPGGDDASTSQSKASAPDEESEEIDNTNNNNHQQDDTHITDEEETGHTPSAGVVITGGQDESYSSTEFFVAKESFQDESEHRDSVISSKTTAGTTTANGGYKHFLEGESLVVETRALR